MRVRYVGLLFAAAVAIAASESRAVASQPNACQIVTRADVAAAVGKGPVAAGRLQQYSGETTSQCQYDSDAGNVVIMFDPTNSNQFLSRYRAGYASSLQNVHGIGDDALYYGAHDTLLIRKKSAVLMLTLDTPDQERGRTIIYSLAHRVVPKLH